MKFLVSLDMTVTSPTIDNLPVGTLEGRYTYITYPYLEYQYSYYLEYQYSPREPQVQTLPPPLATNSTEDVSMRLKPKFECNYYYKLNRDNSVESIIY